MTFVPVATATRDAVVAVINAAMTAGTFAPAPNIQAFAIYDIASGLDAIGGVGRIVVLAADLDPKLLTRGRTQKRDVTVHVALQYKPPAGTFSVAVIDPYQNLIEQLAEFLLGASLSNGGTITGIRFPNGAFVQKHVEEFKAFSSVIALSVTLNTAT